MKQFSFRRLDRVAGLFALATLVFVLPAIGEAVTVGAGMTRSDVGLHNKGDGFYLGVGNAIVWNSPIFDAGYSLEYVQKKGSQPTPFADPETCRAIEPGAMPWKHRWISFTTAPRSR